MAEESILDRFVKSRVAEQKAKENLESLIAKFSQATKKLQTWQSVRFVWHDGNTSSLQGQQETASPEIRIDNVPTLHDIRQAIADWNTADVDLRGLLASLLPSNGKVLDCRLADFCRLKKAGRHGLMTQLSSKFCYIGHRLPQSLNVVIECANYGQESFIGSWHFIAHTCWRGKMRFFLASVPFYHY